MIYWSIGVWLGALLIGYFLGHGEGYRKAHKDMVTRQLVQAKKNLEGKRRPKVVDAPSNHARYDGSGDRKLRLVKNEDTRE